MTFGVIWVTVPKFVVFSSRSIPCLEIDVIDDAINLYIFSQLQISMSLNGGKLSLVTVFIEYFVVCGVLYISSSNCILMHSRDIGKLFNVMSRKVTLINLELL